MEILSIESVSARNRLKIKNAVVLLLFGMIMMIYLPISKYTNADLFILITWFSFCLYLFLADLGFFLKYIIYFYEYITNILGVFIIENKEIYLYELGVDSYRIGSLWLITFIHWLFFFVCYICDNHIENGLARFHSNIEFKINKVKINKILLSSVCVLFGLLLAYMMLKTVGNSASDLQVDRFTYRNEFITGAWGIIHDNLYILLPAIVMLIILGYKKTGFALIALYFLYMVRTGNKFGAFITTFTLFIPWIVTRYKLQRINIKNLKKVFFLGIIIISFVTFTLYYFMSRTYGTNSDVFLEYIYNRLSQQGQMWWALFGKEYGNGMHLDELGKSIGSLFSLNKNVIENYDYGIYKIMKMVMPSSLFQAKVESYSRYAFSTEASFYYYFKTPGLIFFTIILALQSTFIVNWYWKRVKGSNVIYTLVAGLFYVINVSVITQSDFNVMFSKRNFVIVMIYLCILLLGYKKKRIAKDPSNIHINRQGTD